MPIPDTIKGILFDLDGTLIRLPNLDKFFDDLHSQVTTIVSDDSVNHLFTVDKPYIIQINHRLVAQEWKKYFEYMWGEAEK